jgi:hypothetical protein
MQASLALVRGALADSMADLDTKEIGLEARNYCSL